jgi:hypothetical protein
MSYFLYVIIFAAISGISLLTFTVLGYVKIWKFKSSKSNLVLGIFLVGLAAWGYPRYVDMKKIMDAATASERKKAYEESHLNK